MKANSKRLSTNQKLQLHRCIHDLVNYQFKTRQKHQMKQTIMKS